MPADKVSAMRRLPRPAQPITVRTRSDGGFSISAPPGLYTLVVSHGGYNIASTEVAVTNGASSSASVTLQEASLSTLTTIGRTSTTSNSAGTRFNISSSPQVTLSSSTIG